MDTKTTDTRTKPASSSNGFTPDAKSKNVTDLKSKKVAELIDIAKGLGVAGYSDLKK
ncbi:MAG: Rho termination factor N-terminal domain-containing protein, partial [Ignavibacteria bacterium]|nr:Rho termination factor N-terminal domain-containing protein [Ignavibacteria bacterium]